ncbi:ribonuclease H-like domain-containing protein [Candidatus Woesearchaeota archaeon]|nr:ribonuclease H-like domain-containing protein [Candidatus Woesearchaeota archaeon]
MIDQSFIFLPKIGERTERKIWQNGIPDWNCFLSSRVPGFSGARKEILDWRIREAKKHLHHDNLPYFASYFPGNQQWRLWDKYKDDAVFLDIETSGFYGDVTVVGIYNGEESVSLVRGFNLDRHNFEQAMKDAKLVVTFNGRSFDIPVLRRYFNFDLKVPHIDLRFVAQKLGYTGGLKKIEKELGIKRPDEVADVSGAEAVYLWQMWKSTNKPHYLDLLVDYNREDIVNLLPLASRLIPELWRQTRG